MPSLPGFLKGFNLRLPELQKVDWTASFGEELHRITACYCSIHFPPSWQMLNNFVHLLDQGNGRFRQSRDPAAIKFRVAFVSAQTKWFILGLFEGIFATYGKSIGNSFLLPNVKLSQNDNSGSCASCFIMLHAYFWIYSYVFFRI